VRRAIAGLGRTLVTLGLLILLFVVYQLWGTGLFTARAQNDLKHKFEKQLAQAAENDTVGPVPTSVEPKTSTTSTTPTTRFAGIRPAPPIPPEGEVEGAITVPAVPSINFFFVEGTSRDDLKKGPGHYPGTPMPGTIGNAAIAGHRTTYLHPFWDLDKVVPGVDIVVRTTAGTFDYRAYQQLVVPANQVSVVDNTPDAELTLTSCHPKGYAEHRIVVKARLVVAKSSPPAKAQPIVSGTGKGRAAQQATLAEGLSGQQRSLLPSLLWGIFAALVGLAWWWTFRRWRHPLTWVVGVLPFLVALFPFYVYLERALPAGY
jgi:sortase A